MMRPSITSFSWVWGWFELVSLRSCLLGSSSRSLLLHPIHKSIIRFALLLFGLPAQFLRASPGGILFQRSLRFSNAGKAGFTASELRWDVLFSLFNAQPLVFLFGRSCALAPAVLRSRETAASPPRPSARRSSPCACSRSPAPSSHRVRRVRAAPNLLSGKASGLRSSPGVEVDPPNDRFQTKRPPRPSAGQSGRATAS